MLNPKIPGILFLLLFFQNNLSAQDKLSIRFGKVTAEDFNIVSSLIDSSTNAVVVAEAGKSEFIANSNELTFSLKFVVKSRIKIINKNGFDAATVTIPLYVSNKGIEEKLTNLDAYTYNLENGEVVETKVAKSSVFTEKHNKNWIYKKFTFPTLKEGSIIEYKYEVTSDFFSNLQPWTFQGQYPVLWSQYDVAIPEFFKFVILSQGYQPFFINKVDKARVSYSFAEHAEREATSTSNGAGMTAAVNRFTIEGSLDYHTWVMKNIPALKDESFTTTLDNSVAKIEFQLNQIVYPNSSPKNYMDTWEQVARDLMVEEDFGTPINKANNWLDNEVNTIVKNTVSQKEKSQKIFEYVRDNFTCTDRNSIYTAGLKEVFKNKGGSVGDINLLLIAMLRNQKIDANPVILSTREHGFTHEFYPLIDRYNYVIVKVVIDKSIMYLDATSPQLAFGRLPAQVYNGQAREINSNQAIPVYFIADSLKEEGLTNVFISNMEKGGMEGSFSHETGFYESLNLRSKMTKTLPGDYKKSLMMEYPDEIALTNIEIDSLKVLDKPVGIKFDFQLKSFVDNDIVYFDPMMGAAIKKNLFAAAERVYPVEMPYTIDDLYTLTMEIPKGYAVDELPKSTRLNLNEDEGMFEYIISADKENIQLRSRLLLKKATYTNEDYQSLRDFYSFVVKKQAEQIVFKKIK